MTILLHVQLEGRWDQAVRETAVASKPSGCRQVIVVHKLCNNQGLITGLSAINGCLGGGGRYGRQGEEGKRREGGREGGREGAHLTLAWHTTDSHFPILCCKGHTILSGTTPTARFRLIPFLMPTPAEKPSLHNTHGLEPGPEGPTLRSSSRLASDTVFRRYLWTRIKWRDLRALRAAV